MKAQERHVRVAVVQDAPVLFDLPATLDRLERLTGEASRGGARLVLFPQAFVGGYPQGLTFGAVVGSRTPRGHELDRRYWRGALEVGTPECDRIGAIAADNGVHLAVGVVERDGGTLYCSVLFF